MSLGPRTNGICDGCGIQKAHRKNCPYRRSPVEGARETDSAETDVPTVVIPSEPGPEVAVPDLCIPPELIEQFKKRYVIFDSRTKEVIGSGAKPMEAIKNAGDKLNTRTYMTCQWIR